MTVTMDQVRQALLPDEPNYAHAAGLGPEVLPHLAQLIDSDRMLAPKAAFLAGVIGSPDAASVVSAAARSNDPAVRVAAAGTARHLPSGAASEILLVLLRDAHAGVRKAALQSIPTSPSTQLHAQVEALAKGEKNDLLRAIAQEARDRISPPR